MKPDKKKITFVIVIGIVILFMITYSFMTFGGDDSKEGELAQPLVPALKNTEENYTSRLNALDDLKEIRQTNAPSIYDEKYLDSTGVFDPDFLEKEKIRKVDSIYANSRIDYSTSTFKNPPNVTNRDSIVGAIAQKKGTGTKKEFTNETTVDTKEIGLEQQLFFASNPSAEIATEHSPELQVIVDRKQVIKANNRLEMRTLNEVTINGTAIPKNTVFFGIVSFKPNRILLKIRNIAEFPLSFKAYDFRDGLEGIYIVNSFREEVRKQVIGDAVNDINVPGIPQVRGLKSIFQRSNRLVKVTVNPNYILTLKVDSQQ
ncbi:conjugative transposon protein TraM [uncultured Croceitalea sp.]|uniref:conjugative transposon protein TraM n=1 Tax=uncultured Croceitalea sp. TaxID=1798908 RepID=UPI003305BBC7